ncbi:MAG: hypothetical protein J7K87_01135 [Candidatus Aenigmarchaeota archaeon]|nr:hypothetical protein [Candidatus Aenigmarchaeota archaeon]
MKGRVVEVLSLLNISLGFLSMFFFIRGLFDYGAYILILAASIDIVNHVLVRLLTIDTDIFKVVISLGRMTPFGIASALFIVIYFSNLNVLMQLVVLTLGLIFMLISAVRISKIGGMPTLVNGFIIPFIYIFNFFDVYIVSGWLIVSSVLMMSSFRVRKPRKKKKEPKEIEIKDEEEKEKTKENNLVPLPFFGGD